MQLSDEERKRILIEEQYRVQVREQLQPSAPQSWHERILAFVNSNFGLWLLSAVFIVGTGGVFSCWQHERDRVIDLREKERDNERAEHAKRSEEQRAEREREAVRSAKIGKFDREISFRISHILVELSRVLDEEQHPELINSELIKSKLREARACLHVSAEGATNAGLYPDLATFTLAALVADLRSEVIAKCDREELDEVLHTLAEWRNEPLYPAAKTGNMILRGLLLERWRPFGFLYTDCPPSTAFPCYKLETAM
jgi:hypothetical protein